MIAAAAATITAILTQSVPPVTGAGEPDGEPAR
jgi:hypothetical protein